MRSTAPVAQTSKACNTPRSGLLRGLRSPQDLSYEQPIELINKHMAPELEVVHLLSSPETSMISSTIVREVIKYKGHIKGLLPDEIIDYVSELKYSES